MYIAVFCSANETIDPTFVSRTEALGVWLAQEGHTLVYGGCDKGLMRVIGQTVHRCGGRTIGYVPRIIERENCIADCLDVFIPVATLSDRKDLMVEKADFIIALPGGLGTLDEVFTVAAAHTIGYHRKRVVLYNMNGFYDPLLAVLSAMQAQGMIRGEWSSFITAVSSLEEIKDMVKIVQ